MCVQLSLSMLRVSVRVCNVHSTLSCILRIPVGVVHIVCESVSVGVSVTVCVSK